MPGLAKGYNPEDLPDYLRIYYKLLFPYKPYFKWICYGKKPSEYFMRREFAFILKDDVYLRYRSFSDQSELEKAIQKDVPYKIDIGAVFNFAPKDRARPGFDAQERELIFDIDLTDYDDIRTCCSGGSMCKKCWKFMVIAIKVLDIALEEDFGFKHRLWLFSGRRGVHCWVADQMARKLSPQGRSAVADYLSVLSGGEQTAKKVSLFGDQIHPSLRRACEMIIGHSKSTDLFGQLAMDQGWFDDEESWKKLLDLCTESKPRELMARDFVSLKTPQDRWKALKERFGFGKDGVDCGKERVQPNGKARWFLHELVLQYSYPRLDINVTKGLNHLLKSPFCIHPKTGKVSVPLNTKLLTKFDPETVPRIELLEEIGQMKDCGNELEETEKPARKTLEYKKTSLAPFVDIFEDFVENLIRDSESDANNSRPAMDF